MGGWGPTVGVKSLRHGTCGLFLIGSSSAQALELVAHASAACRAERALKRLQLRREVAPFSSPAHQIKSWLPPSVVWRVFFGLFRSVYLAHVWREKTRIFSLDAVERCR